MKKRLFVFSMAIAGFLGQLPAALADTSFMAYDGTAESKADHDDDFVADSFTKTYLGGCASVTVRPNHKLIQVLRSADPRTIRLADAQGVLVVERNVVKNCKGIKMNALDAVLAAFPQPKCERCPSGGGWFLIDSFDHKTKLNGCVSVNTTTDVYARVTTNPQTGVQYEIHSESRSEFIYTVSDSCSPPE